MDDNWKKLAAAATGIAAVAPFVARFQDIRMIDAAGRFVKSMTDGISKQPELCLVLASGSMVGVASFMLWKQPKLEKPEKKKTTSPEEAVVAEKEFNDAMHEYAEAKLFREIAFKGILVMSGVIVVGTMYIAVTVSDRAAAHQKVLNDISIKEATYRTSLAEMVAKSKVELSSAVQQIVGKVWANANGAMTSFAVVYNDTLEYVPIVADQKWGFSFNGTDHAYLPPGGLDLLKANMAACLLAEGVSIKVEGGEWYSAKHLQFIPVSQLKKK